MSPVLKRGVTLSGQVGVTRIFWNIILRGKTTELSHKSSIWPDIPSGPVALLGFKFRINENISSHCMDIWSIVLSVSKLSGASPLL